MDQNPNPFIKPSIHLPHRHLPEAEKAFEATPMMARTCVKETLDAWRGGEILEKWRWLLKAKANVFRDVSYCFNPGFFNMFWHPSLSFHEILPRALNPFFGHFRGFKVRVRLFSHSLCQGISGTLQFSAKKKKKRCSNKDISPSPGSYVMIQHDPNATRRRLERTLSSISFFSQHGTHGKHHVETPGLNFS